MEISSILFKFVWHKWENKKDLHSYIKILSTQTCGSVCVFAFLHSLFWVPKCRSTATCGVLRPPRCWSECHHADDDIISMLYDVSVHRRGEDLKCHFQRGKQKKPEDIFWRVTRRSRSNAAIVIPMFSLRHPADIHVLLRNAQCTTWKWSNRTLRGETLQIFLRVSNPHGILKWAWEPARWRQRAIYCSTKHFRNNLSCVM